MGKKREKTVSTSKEVDQTRVTRPITKDVIDDVIIHSVGYAMRCKAERECTENALSRLGVETKQCGDNAEGGFLMSALVLLGVEHTELAEPVAASIHRAFYSKDWGSPDEFIKHAKSLIDKAELPVSAPKFDPDLSHLCESPIEVMFYDACAASDFEFPEEKSLFSTLRPQYKIGPFRADFAVVEHRIVIELDGHEYHKTKEQRTSDADRERMIDKVGWKVIRFTGSEIWKNARECVDDVETAIRNHGRNGKFGRNIDSIADFAEGN